MQVVQKDFIRNCYPFELFLNLFDRFPQEHSHPSRRLGSVVDAFDGHFLGAVERDSCDFFVYFLENGLWKFQSFFEDRIDEMVEGVDEVVADNFDFG